MLLPSLLATSYKGRARGASTARVERGPSEGARSASTEDPRARPSPSPSSMRRMEGMGTAVAA